MDHFAQRPREERAEVFEETSVRRGIGRPAIVEKDFWVCWALHQLQPFFGEAAFRQGTNQATQGLLFKGGTSLSKVYNVIDRFSEDIDLTIDRDALGFTEDSELSNPNTGNRQRDRLLDRLSHAAADFVARRITPVLQSALELTTQDADPATIGLRIDTSDAQTIHLAYPRALRDVAYAPGGYVRPEVRLEFGARGELWPAHRAAVKPYVAEEFGQLFDVSSVPVNVLDIARTLWEKATILHQIAHTGRVRSRERMSRHYYDLSQLVQTPAGELALTDLNLLFSVAEHKRLFFRQASARYELARPGTLRLIPLQSVLDSVAKDYSHMREMFYSDPPTFDRIVSVLRSVELKINGV